MIAKNKRVINGYNLADMRLQEWVDWKSYGAQQVFIAAMQRLGSRLQQDRERWLGFIHKYGLDNLLASFAWSEVNIRIQYIGDTERFKRIDWWELPSECYNWEAGDCEGSTYLLVSCLELIRELVKRSKDWQFATLGYYHDYKQYYGHAFPLFWNSYLAHWNVLESTWDSEVNPFIWVKWNPEQYIPAIAFNRHRTYRFDLASHRRLFGLSDAWYERHKEAIQAMIKYVTMAKRLKVSWMHKGKRPVPLQMENLEVMV